MKNIPNGYDENGVRNGNGRWVDVEEQENEIGGFDEYDYYKELREAEKGVFVECDKCHKLVKEKTTTKVWYGTGYLCRECSKTLDKLNNK